MTDNVSRAGVFMQRKLSVAMLTYLIIYLLASLVLGQLLIDYTPVSFFSILCFFSCLLLFVVGCWLGEKTQFAIRPVLTVNLASFMKVITWLSFVFMLISWWYNLRYWGGIGYIVSHAMQIRNSVIGGNSDFIPGWLGYISSLSYLAFLAGMFLFVNGIKRKKNRVVFFCYLLVNIISILLQDLLSFGRIGLVFTFFSIIAFMLIFLPLRKIINTRNFIVLLMALVLVNAPRIIRGGGDMFMASLSEKASSINIPLNPYNAGLVINFIYYFSSPYAFDYWLKNTDGSERSYGERTFTPVFNVMSKVFASDKRPQLIDDNAWVPFRHNIFSVAKDYYMDFGTVGLIIIPFALGFSGGRQSMLSRRGIVQGKVNYINLMLSVFMLACFIYAPLYNVFSFGKFLIPWIFMYFCSFLIQLRDRDAFFNHR